MRRILAVVAGLAVITWLAAVPAAERTDAGVATDFTLSLDCDKNTAGIQAACTVPVGPSLDVNLVLTNNTGASRELNGFSFEVHDPDTVRMIPPPIGCSAPCHSSNPDVNQQGLGTDFSCAPPLPDNDTGEDGPGTAVSFLSCTNSALTGPSIPAGGSILLGFVRYAVLGNAPGGTVALSLADAIAMEDGATELGSCAPVVTTAMTCDGASVIVAPASMLVDCNTTQMGVQSVCHVSNLLATRDVNVVVRNNSNAAWTLGTFNFTLVHLDDSRLFAPPMPNPGTLNENPDFIAATTGLGDWSCGPTDPTGDLNQFPSDPGQRSFISCFNASGTGPSIGASAVSPLAAVHYNIPPGADPGSVMLTWQDVGLADSTFNARGSCNPVVDVPAHCPATELIFYCPIDQADVNNDGRVNSIDLGKTAQQYGVQPAPAAYDQNFDGVINSIDLGLVALQFGGMVSNCP